MKTLAAVLIALAPAGIASAQILGTVSITANGGSHTTVAPGTPVSIGVHVAYVSSALQLAGLQGAVRVDGDAGVGSNFVFHLGAGPLINTGSFQGGSRVGMDVASGPPQFFGINPLWSQNPVNMLRYDLTLDEPGEYTVIWELPASGAGIRLYFSQIIIPPQGTTALEGATIIVTPAPASVGALVGLGLIGGRRRRP